MPQRTAAPPERIVQNVAIDEHGCWVWQRPLQPTGYGRLKVNGRATLAHRFSYETFIGPIPEGLHLDHLCRNRACVNPEHLEPVTCKVNLLRSPISNAAINKAKTHCPQGHEYTPENTYVRSNGRTCRTCALASMRRYDAKRRATRQAVAR